MNLFNELEEHQKKLFLYFHKTDVLQKTEYFIFLFIFSIEATAAKYVCEQNYISCIEALCIG